MTYRYIENLRSAAARKTADLSKFKPSVPQFSSKAGYRAWCADTKTKHIFYSTVEGRAPSKRVSSENPTNKVYGIVADYDAPVNWSMVDGKIATICANSLPTWRSKTYSGYIRLVWEFEKAVPVPPDMFAAFAK